MKALMASARRVAADTVGALNSLRSRSHDETAAQETDGSPPFLADMRRSDPFVRRKYERQAFLAVAVTLLILFALNAAADSLWKDEVSRPLVADKRAAGVGDILTIVVQESTTTAKDQNTKTTKSTGMDGSISSFLYPASATGLLSKKGKLPAMQYELKNDYSGGGAINNSEKIVARIAVRVIDVLPNRNLVIEGTKDTAFSGEQQTAILRGTVRPEDIAGNNTVFSYNVADATIKFVSKGSISDTQNKGWFTKVWDWLTPF